MQAIQGERPCSQGVPDRVHSGVQLGGSQEAGIAPDEDDELDWAAWENDLAIEDLLKIYKGFDVSKVQVDLKGGPSESMSPLEREASTLVFDGATATRLSTIFWFLNWGARHNIIHVAMDDLL
jgi:hypothetical protein